MDKIVLPEDVKYILNTLKKNNYEGYIVGGSVRDSIMGLQPMDYDITSNALPQDIIGLFKKTFETGIEHGTITVVLNNINYEITTYRVDGEYENNRKPKDVTFTSNLYDDIRRRDFTINAICYNPDDGIVDYFNGIKDIENKIIRAVGDPNLRFQEDALRMIRAIRFQCKLGFEMEKETLEGIYSNNYLFKNISAERVREEFTKILLSHHHQNLQVLIDSKLMSYFDEDFHEYLKDNISLISPGCKNPIYAYSCLFNNASPEQIKYFLGKLKFDNFTIKSCISINKGMEYPMETIIDIRKLISTFGIEIAYIILDLKEIYEVSTPDQKKYYNSILGNKDPLFIKDLKVDGNTLKSMGYTGKGIGKILNHLLNKVLEDPHLNTKELLIDIINNSFAII